MSLKGHAKIELTDVNTGKTEVIEHDNMITNGILKVLNKHNITRPIVDNETAVASTEWTIVNNWFGGLMLFDTPLNDDINDYAIPSDATCVGYGTRVANNTINSLLGTFNTSESDIISDDGSVKFVWDFATNQGNGTISSLSLVPLEVAKMGWSNKIEEYITTFYSDKVFSFYLGQNLSYDIDGYLYYDDAYIYGIERGNITTVDGTMQENHFSKTGKIRLIKRKFPSKKVSIFDFPTKPVSHEPILEAEIQIPSEMMSIITSVTSDKVFYHIEKDQNYIYFYANSSSSVDINSTFYLLRIDIDTYATELITMNNTTGRKIGIGNMTGTYSSDQGLIRSSYSYMRIVNGKLVVTPDNICDIIDISNNTDVKRAKQNDDSESFYCSVTGFKYKDYLFAYASTGEVSYCNCINVRTGTTFRIYISLLYSFCGGWHFKTSAAGPSFYLNCLITHKTDDEMPHIFSAYYSSSLLRFSVYFNPLILMTKNNLDSPVTKTSSQTMKITYTLTEEIT